MKKITILLSVTLILAVSVYCIVRVIEIKRVSTFGPYLISTMDISHLTEKSKSIIRGGRYVVVPESVIEFPNMQQYMLFTIEPVRSEAFPRKNYRAYVFSPDLNLILAEIKFITDQFDKDHPPGVFQQMRFFVAASTAKIRARVKNAARSIAGIIHPESKDEVSFINRYLSIPICDKPVDTSSRTFTECQIDAALQHHIDATRIFFPQTMELLQSIEDCKNTQGATP